MKYEKAQLVAAGGGSGSLPVQGFAPRSIVTTTVLDTTNVTAIRVTAGAVYYINTDSGNTASIGEITIIDPTVESITFAGPTVVEIM